MESRRNSRMSQFRFDEKTSFAMRLIARQRNQKLTAAVSNAIRQAATHLDLGGHSWLDLYDDHEGICLLLCLACPTYQPSPEQYAVAASLQTLFAPQPPTKTAIKIKRMRSSVCGVYQNRGSPNEKQTKRRCRVCCGAHGLYFERSSPSRAPRGPQMDQPGTGGGTARARRVKCAPM